MRPRLYRVWLYHERTGCDEVRRVAAYDKTQAINYAIRRVRADAKAEGSVLHDHGADLSPRGWRAEKVEEVPSLVTGGG